MAPRTSTFPLNSVEESGCNSEPLLHTGRSTVALMNDWCVGLQAMKLRRKRGAGVVRSRLKS